MSDINNPDYNNANFSYDVLMARYKEYNKWFQAKMTAKLQGVSLKDSGGTPITSFWGAFEYVKDTDLEPYKGKNTLENVFIALENSFQEVIKDEVISQQENKRISDLDANILRVIGMHSDVVPDTTKGNLHLSVPTAQRKVTKNVVTQGLKPSIRDEYPNVSLFFDKAFNWIKKNFITGAVDIVHNSLSFLKIDGKGNAFVVVKGALTKFVKDFYLQCTSLDFLVIGKSFFSFKNKVELNTKEVLTLTEGDVKNTIKGDYALIVKGALTVDASSIELNGKKVVLNGGIILTLNSDGTVFVNSKAGITLDGTGSKVVSPMLKSDKQTSTIGVVSS